MKFQKLTVLGKEYEFIKPKGVHIMFAEDKAVKMGKGLDLYVLYSEYLKFVSKDLTVESFEKDIDPIIVIGEKTFTLKDTSFRTKTEIESKQYSGSHFNRVAAIEAILDNVVEDYKIEELEFEELEALHLAYSSRIDDSELLEVIESIKTFR